jgi:hypothetical protein
MKKIFISMLAMLAFSSTAFGENLITVNDFTVSSVSKTALMVNINLDEKSSAKSMLFTISLPDGLEFVTSAGKPVYKSGAMFNVEPTLNIEEGKLKVAIASSNYIQGSKGMLIAFQIQPSSSFSASKGDVLTGGAVTDVSASIKGSLVDLDDDGFKVTVTDCIVLDENSPFPPETTSDAVDILVKRTIKAGVWSTICLPFVIQSGDLAKIFGSEYELAEFAGYDSEDNFETMSINFKKKTTGNFTAGNVYLIKASTPIEEISYKAKISRSAAPTVTYQVTEYDEDAGEDVPVEKGKFIGTYVADTYVPGDDMFISGNQFYYSTGKSKIKGFRGYFWFKDKLKNNSTARAFFNIDGEGTTKIQNAQISKNETGKVYSISGRYMGEKVNMKSLPKGVYVVDGVKVINN